MSRILVIEDIAAVRDGIADTLLLNGYQVITARDGIEGLQLAREQLPDVIICDIMMPELDGYEVLRELRSDSVTVPIPFIFLTAKAERPERRLGMELGADDYLTKPFKDWELLGAIKTRLEKRMTLETHQLRTLTRKSLRLREEDRRSFARKIHDDVNQPLAGLKLSLHGVERLSAQRLELKVSEIQRQADQILSQVTAALYDVWPLVLEDLGLLPALLQLFDQFYASTQIRVNFEHSRLEPRLLLDVKIAVYRVIEETLSNVARHAQVSVVKVAVWAEANILQLSVEDEGIGFDLEKVAETNVTNGLVEINERVSNLDGELSIWSELGAGVRILARIPLANRYDGDEISPPEDQVSSPKANVQTRQSSRKISREEIPKTANFASSLTTRIVIAEENQILREGLKGLLEAVDSFMVSREAIRRDEVLRLVGDLQPNVLILGFTMSGSNTLDLVDPLKKFLPDLRILIFSSHANEMYSYEALRRGASGYILTNIQADDLVNAVRQVASGKEYWSIPIPDDFMDVRLGAYGSGDPELSIYETLTRREREILAMIAQGNTSRQIAVALSISPRTAETHRTNIGRKLGLRTQADLIRYAIEHGLE